MYIDDKNILFDLMPDENIVLRLKKDLKSRNGTFTKNARIIMNHMEKFDDKDTAIYQIVSSDQSDYIVFNLPESGMSETQKDKYKNLILDFIDQHFIIDRDASEEYRNWKKENDKLRFSKNLSLILIIISSIIIITDLVISIFDLSEFTFFIFVLLFAILLTMILYNSKKKKIKNGLKKILSDTVTHMEG